METTAMLADKYVMDADFKLRWLNSTLEFIKDDTRVSYVSCDMPISCALYLNALIHQRENDVVFGSKSIYSPLWEAMEIFGYKYTYNVSVLSASDDVGRLKIVKVLKLVDNDVEILSVSSEESDSYSQHATKRLSKVQRFIVRQRKVIERISPAFIKCTLQVILDFINDEAMGSLRLEELAPSEAEFVESIKSIYKRKKRFSKLLSPASISILDQISDRLTIKYRDMFDLIISSQVRNERTSKREITIRKEPHFETSPIEDAVQEDMNACSSHAEKKAKTSPPYRGNRQNNKIMEAMQVPLESDIGSRMMRLMGWQGGALGRRGEGIVEPIMPLFRKPGTGLGHGSQNHTTTESQTKNMKGKFLQDYVLESILKVLRDRRTVSIKCRDKKVFLLTCLKNVNRRIVMPIKRARSKQLLIEIMQETSRDPEVGVDFSFDTRNSECILIPTTIYALKMKYPETLSAPNEPTTEKELKVFLADIKQRLVENDKKKPKKQIDQRLLLKIYVLDKISEFVKSEEAELRIDCFFGCNKYLYKYLTDLFSTINTGAQFIPSYNTEEKVVLEIQQNKTAELSVELSCRLLMIRKNNDATLTNIFKSVKDIEAGVDNSDLDMNDSMPKDDYDLSDISIKSPQSASFKDNSKIIPLEGCNGNTSNNKVDGGIVETINSISVTIEGCDNKTKSVTVVKNRDNNNKVDVHENNDIENASHASQEEATVKLSSLLSKANIGEEDIRNNKETCNNNYLPARNFNNMDTSWNIDASMVLNDTDKNSIFNINKLEPSSGMNSNRLRNNTIISQSAEFVSNTNNKKIIVFDYKGYNVFKIYSENVGNPVEQLSGTIQKLIIANDNCKYNLKCHGIQNGGLVYSFSDETLKNILSKNFIVKFHIKYVDNIKMKVNINRYLDVNDVLNKLPSYNNGIVTKDWRILEETSKHFVVEVDCDSFKFVSEKMFCLFAGIDTALFTIFL